MREVKPDPVRLSDRMGLALDKAFRIISPKRAFQRAQFRAAYDAIDGHRVRKRRSSTGGTGDTHLSSSALDDLREIHREYMRNNPLVEGLLLMELDEIIGDVYPKVQARSGDDGWNVEAENQWKAEMVDNPCEVTGRFNVHQLIGMGFLSYRRDGDFFLCLRGDRLQAFEGDCVGTPLGGINANHYRVINGIAYSKKSQQIVGYFVGKPADNGFYIEPNSFQRINGQHIHHVFNPQRLSQSRGEPVLKSSITKIDQLDNYINSELIAANVNACFSMFIARKDPSTTPDPMSNIDFGGSTETENGTQYEKMEPGTIMYGEPGEEARGIGMERPGSMFDPFVTRMLSFITRPMAIPMMMALGDFSGATFMNTRVGYQLVQGRWRREQQWVVRPLASRIWCWFIARQIRSGLLKDRDDAFTHSVQLKRWPYVDPYREAQAEKLQLENKTGTRREFIEARGKDYEEVLVQIEKEKKDFEVKNQEAA